MEARNEKDMQAAHHAGRAAVLHAVVNGLLATQRLSEAEVLAFFKAVRDTLELEVTNTGRIQAVLQHTDFMEPVGNQIVGAFREAIELQLRLRYPQLSKAAYELRPITRIFPTRCYYRPWLQGSIGSSDGGAHSLDRPDRLRPPPEPPSSRRTGSISSGCGRISG